MIHMICGSTGAGKTTFTRVLAEKHGAIYFSIDEWMQNLYGIERTPETELDWMLERINRCETQIWQMCEQLISLNQDVILDLGLSKKSHREKFYRLANAIGVEVTLYHLDIAPDVRWQRVVSRNTNKDVTYSFEVTREMFDFMEQWFESPEKDEHSNIMLINNIAS